jgi:hypothetical protein
MILAGNSTIKGFVIAAALCLLMGSQSTAATIEFTMDDMAASGDLGRIIEMSNRYPPLDDEKYKALGKGFRVQDVPVETTGGEKYQLILICGEIAQNGRARGIQLLLVDDFPARAKVIQRLKLGEGEAPQLVTPIHGGSDIMFRVIRAGNNTEGSVYSIDPATGKLSEKLKIDRSFPKRQKLDIKGTLMPGGFIDIASKEPPVKERVDLSGAIDALAEDEIYQDDERPVPSLANLSLVRNGWEDERIYSVEGSIRVEVGMSLVTLSKKQILDVTALLSKNSSGAWNVTELKFEPFMPYR